MRYLLLFTLLLQGVLLYPQKDPKGAGLHQRQLLADSGVQQKLIQLSDSNLIQRMDPQQIQENISRNMDSLLELQKEQKARQKRAAMIRIGIGVALLVLLVIGIRRKGKK